MRVFVSIREYPLNHRELSEKIRELESTCNQQFDNVFDALNYLIQKEQQQKKSKKELVTYNNDRFQCYHKL